MASSNVISNHLVIAINPPTTQFSIEDNHFPDHRLVAVLLLCKSLTLKPLKQPRLAVQCLAKNNQKTPLDNRQTAFKLSDVVVLRRGPQCMRDGTIVSRTFQVYL